MYNAGKIMAIVDCLDCPCRQGHCYYFEIILNIRAGLLFYLYRQPEGLRGGPQLGSAVRAVEFLGSVPGSSKKG